MNNFAAFGLNCFYVFNILIGMNTGYCRYATFGSINQKMAVIRLILTAEYECLGPN